MIYDNLIRYDPFTVQQRSLELKPAYIYITLSTVLLHF